MYAVVQIGSRIARLLCGTMRSTLDWAQACWANDALPASSRAIKVWRMFMGGTFSARFSGTPDAQGVPAAVAHCEDAAASRPSGTNTGALPRSCVALVRAAPRSVAPRQRRGLFAEVVEQAGH